MTREEAIGYLKRADTTVGMKIKTKTAEAIEMAIKALEQEETVSFDMDKMVKVNMYLLRQCKDKLILKFNLDLNNPFEILRFFDLIAVEMNKEMPDFWYKYMACCGGSEER